MTSPPVNTNCMHLKPKHTGLHEVFVVTDIFHQSARASHVVGKRGNFFRRRWMFARGVWLQFNN